MHIVNFDLIANPLNWLIVFTMLMIAGIVVTLINASSEE